MVCGLGTGPLSSIGNGFISSNTSIFCGPIPPGPGFGVGISTLIGVKLLSWTDNPVFLERAPCATSARPVFLRIPSVLLFAPMNALLAISIARLLVLVMLRLLFLFQLGLGHLTLCQLILCLIFHHF